MSGATVLLLHGFLLDSRMWTGHRAALEDAGFAVVAPDLPGDVPETRFERWATRVLGLVEGEFVPVGLSMGGYLTFELWRQAPDRIRAMVLVDTRAQPETPESREGRDDMIMAAGEEGVEAVWDRMRPKLFAPGADAEVVSQTRAMALELPVTGIVAALSAIRDRADSRPDLASIDVPALVVVGEEDALTPPADAEAIVSALPDARLVRLPGAGHLPPLERPEEFLASLRGFLEELG